MVVPEIGLSKKSSAFEKETLRSMFERSPVELIWLERKAWDVCLLLPYPAECSTTADAFNFDRIKSDDSESRSFTSIQYPCDSSQSSISSRSSSSPINYDHSPFNRNLSSASRSIGNQVGKREARGRRKKRGVAVLRSEV